MKKMENKVEKTAVVVGIVIVIMSTIVVVVVAVGRNIAVAAIAKMEMDLIENTMNLKYSVKKIIIIITGASTIHSIEKILLY